MRKSQRRAAGAQSPGLTADAGKTQVPNRAREPASPKESATAHPKVRDPRSGTQGREGVQGRKGERDKVHGGWEFTATDTGGVSTQVLRTNLQLWTVQVSRAAATSSHTMGKLWAWGSSA